MLPRARRRMEIRRCATSLYFVRVRGRIICRSTGLTTLRTSSLPSNLRESNRQLHPSLRGGFLMIPKGKYISAECPPCSLTGLADLFENPLMLSSMRQHPSAVGYSRRPGELETPSSGHMRTGWRSRQLRWSRSRRRAAPCACRTRAASSPCRDRRRTREGQEVRRRPSQTLPIIWRQPNALSPPAQAATSTGPSKASSRLAWPGVGAASPHGQRRRTSASRAPSGDGMAMAAASHSASLGRRRRAQRHHASASNQVTNSTGACGESSSSAR